MNSIITIFTPTYNRSYILPKLYNSLCNQTCMNFKWLIVDDGSTDETELLVNQWINEAKLDITYIKQKNQGKHIAHNTGVENCETDLFFCVDSDDYLLNHAIESILKNKDKIINSHISGILSLKLTESFKPVGTNMPSGVCYCSLSDLYEKYAFKGDTALVFKSKILKKFLFPKIEEEKFIGEEYIYCQIDEKYKLFVSHESYYICNYLEDGYTSNIFKLIVNNPRGYKELKSIKLKTSTNFITCIKAAALYIIGCWLSKESSIVKNSPKKIYTILAYPLALLIYSIRFYKIVRRGKSC